MAGLQKVGPNHDRHDDPLARQQSGRGRDDGQEGLIVPKMDAETKAYLKATASRLVYLATIAPPLLEIAQNLYDVADGKRTSELSMSQLQMVYDRLNGD